MFAAKHVPVFPVPYSKLSFSALSGASIAVNQEPTQLPLQQAPVLESFVRAGKTVIEGPPLSAKPAQADDDFVLDPADTRVEATWQKVSGAVGRRNMGVRLFNVASMLSNLLALHGQRQLVLHLVNYSDYPVSGVTARIVGVWRHARLYRPGEAPVDIETEKVEDGTGFAIDQRIMTIATVVLE